MDFVTRCTFILSEISIYVWKFSTQTIRQLHSIVYLSHFKNIEISKGDAYSALNVTANREEKNESNT